MDEINHRLAQAQDARRQQQMLLDAYQRAVAQQQQRAVPQPLYTIQVEGDLVVVKRTHDKTVVVAVPLADLRTILGQVMLDAFR